MANSDTVSTPMDSATKLTTVTEDKLFEHPTLYREAIGALLYASMGTRPNITFAVQTLSQFASKPSKEHWQAVKRVLQYLQGTKNLGITYGDTDGHVDIHIAGYVISHSLRVPGTRVRLIAKPVLIGSLPDLINLGCWSIALWEFQVRHQGELPSQQDQAAELESIRETLISERITNKSLLKGSSTDLIALVQLSQSYRGED